MRLLLSIAIVIFLAGGCVAQTRRDNQPISDGVLNKKALSLPQPDYPVDLPRLGGMIRIQVLIDETGKVVSAKAVSGLENVSLRAAAESAALKATFSPTLLYGKPVRVSGVITYNFVAVKSDEDKLEVMSLAAFLIVVGSSASDLVTLKDMMDEREFFKDDFAEFPRFAEDLKPLMLLQQLPIDKRLELIVRVISSIRSRLNESDKWQFEVGKNLGEMLGPIMTQAASEGAHFDVTAIDAVHIKVNLNNLRDLTQKPPPDFPDEVLKKLKALSALGARESLKNTKDFEEFYTDLDALADLIP
jgi:hypothetical protein